MLNLLDFTALVQRFAVQARASATAVLDFTVGSVFRAMAEANAAVALWLQWLILVVLRQTRLATSQGSEVDTWCADFGLFRLPATPAAGAVTFSRNTSGLAALIPVGTTVRSTDGTQSFIVTTDPSNLAWNGTGYAVAANALSVILPVQAAVGGSAGNVQPGTVTVLTSAIPGIDTVTNALAFSGGIDPESDAALRARFLLFIAGLSKATLAAIASAIASVQQGLTYAVAANVDNLGGYRPGNFVITVDDGTGAPSIDLLNRVYTAVDAVRSVAETFSVQAPTIVTVAVSMTLTAAPGYLKANLQGPVAAAVTAYINTLPIGAPLLYTRLAQIALDAVSGIASITALVVNGAQADISVSASGVLKASTVSVN